MTAATSDWIECVCDFNGNHRSPGVAADTYRHDENRVVMVLQGAWSYYDERLSDEIIDEFMFDVTGIDSNLLSNVLDGPAAAATDYVLALPRIVRPRLMLF